ncbi:Hydroxyproline-rich glyco family [Micractinium conductrix]|uniref:Hydroxyproline-rich glyco family n=1 Tax=Micractinium conductrix TaxID=554055 RepID=A0A2P6VF11_9CHLO|nr:Hydroxyproline-rich glyco family [Micractinium conductrix]|eukprot:PSC72685.1 Hydroxyproline-rich glyco family [Micractinium conductrix]
MFGSATPAFGAASTPAFGAASTPSLFGGGTSAPAFGQSAPAFGASPFVASTPAFSAAAGGSSLFGAASTPAFGAASTPSLFGAAPAASGGGLFGAASTPSLFGAASSGGLFGTASAGALTTTAAPSFGFGQTGAAPSLFGGAQPAAGQAVTALATKDGRPITHTSKWDDLSPQTQQYLSELEKVVVQCREECRQLDADPRLASAGGAREQQQEGMQGQARTLSQAIAALGSSVKADVEQVGALREAVLYLVRATDTALHAFKRSHAWREAAKASTPLAQADIAGPPVLPSSFLREAIAGFLDRLRQHQAAVAELEAVLVGGAGQHLRRAAGSQPADGLQALQGALTNVHDLLIHTAARLQALDDRVSAARDSHLARRRAAADFSDPFAEEERRQAKHAEHQPRSPAAQAAVLQAAQQQHAAAAPPGTAAAHATMFGASPAAAHAASPGGLFGTVSPTPGRGGFGTPLFGAQQQRSAPSSRKPGSRRR